MEIPDFSGIREIRNERGEAKFLLLVKNRLASLKYENLIENCGCRVK